MNYSKEEQKKIMKMSPEEWQEYKKAHKQLELDSKEFAELKIKLEAERNKYIKESGELNKEFADYYHQENLAEYERIRNEILKKEKEEYLKRLREESDKKKKKGYPVKYIIIGAIAAVIIIIIVSAIVSNRKKESTHFTREEIEALQANQNDNSSGEYDSSTGLFVPDNETDEMKAFDKKLLEDSKVKLYYERHTIGILNYSRSIDMSLFTQKNTKDGLVELAPKYTKYYQLLLNNDTNKDNRQIKSFTIDYDNLQYMSDNRVYVMYEDFVINRSTTYEQVKNYFAAKTNDIREYSDTKKHMEINIEGCKIIIDSFEDAKIKPVGTVDKISVERV